MVTRETLGKLVNTGIWYGKFRWNMTSLNIGESKFYDKMYEMSFSVSIKPLKLSCKITNVHRPTTTPVANTTLPCVLSDVHGALCY